ncbi:hypothetical protein NDI56_05220 [Haloarcula sp. S1CR25-12]|uniref:Gins51 C-terminal domain-containing protein n=1 Tax=Haloarcula saliterrae TaxID=2950534 RepID=A0ABU2F951_9EURY|nr:hypothetical protein [Haloarcula sp. S1CR25-12]MDS0258792.1 hypothetical protein [Haloarcula sp. S1CR25-12]
MKLDELQSVQSRERQTDQLQQLRATFYEEAGQFVAQLREERERAAERADDPFDAPEVNRLTDDIKTAEQTVEAVYERRVGKIVKMASLAAADIPTEDDGLTQEERTLFETMVEAIEQNREHVLDVVAGEAPTGAVGGGESSTTPSEPTDNAASEPADPTSTPTGTEPEVDAADIMGGGDGSTAPGEEPPPSPADDTSPSGTDEQTPPAPPGPSDDDAGASPDRPADEALSAVDADGTADETLSADDSDGPPADDSGTTPEIDRKTVRITDDVGEIFGVDQREYDLSADDVVTLPADNADPLVERDAAEPLE